MESYEELRLKLTNTQINQNLLQKKKKKKKKKERKTETTLRMTKKKFEDDELPHELFLTKGQKAKIIMLLQTICQQIKKLVNLKYLK